MADKQKSGLAKLIVGTIVKKVLGDCESEAHELVGDIDRSSKERRAAAIQHRNEQVARGNEVMRGALEHTARGLRLIQDQRSDDGVRNLLLEEQESELRHRLTRDLTHSHGVNDDETAESAIETLASEVVDEIVG